MDINRKTAFDVLIDVEKNGAYSNLSLNNFIKKNSPDSQAFVRELVYGVLKTKLRLDYMLKPFVAKGFGKLNIKDLTLLRMGAYQMMFMDSVPEYAAVSETVEITKKLVSGREKFINGVLRSLARDRLDIVFPDSENDPVKYLSVYYSVNPWIAEKFVSSYGFSGARDILKAMGETPELVIRVNILKTTRAELKEKLSDEGFEVKESDKSERALIVSGQDVLRSKLYKEGLFTVQDLSSIIAIDMLSPEKGEYIVDTCAAPGGKTFAMAELMGNSGEIHAMDIYEHKLELMKKGAERTGVTIVNTKVHDAAKLVNEFQGKADKVLCDVPCSGLGVIQRKPEIRYKSDSDMEELINRQAKILRTAANYVKTGGTLMYSTCTVNPDENERQIARFLDKNTDFTKVDEKQLLPTDGTDGFYICKMKRA